MNTISEMILFNNLLKNMSSTGNIRIVGILYFYMNMMSMKQWMELELTRVQKVGFWMWFAL